jgi:hypothetical protein
MDNHPIPQDVTGFQFKLIGAMTVKQFGYVAVGVVMAVILYYLPIQSAFGVLLKVLLIPLFGSSGVIIAFVPVDGRPIDLMTTNFVKAVFSPNQYVYHRQGKQLSFTAISSPKAPTVKKTQQQAQHHASTSVQQLNQKEEKLRALLLSSHGQIKNAADKKEAAFLKTLTVPTTSAIPSHQVIQKPLATTPATKPALAPSLPIIQRAPPIVASQPPNMQNIPSSQNNPSDLSKKESELEQELTQAKQADSLSKTPAMHTAAQQKIELLSKQIQQIHAEKQKLEQELSQLQKRLITEKGATTSSTQPIAKQPTQDPQHVRVIPQGVTKRVGLPHVSDSPNVVVGIVKDPRENVLPNILVEVKDKDGNPVRAFKTNQLGQFASATPLSTGTYTIELEDPKNQQKFDIVQITANNQILLPIEIISHDAREELRKQLFAN